jgi:Fe-S-cluster-containing dehydrogenase component
MACKMGNALDDDDYRITVRTLGSGAGIDRPAGTYPDLTMGWMPVYNTSCVFCAERVAADEEPYCIHDCPTEALAFGDDKPGSAYTEALERVRKSGAHIFEMPAWEATRKNITYARK